MSELSIYLLFILFGEWTANRLRAMFTHILPRKPSFFFLVLVLEVDSVHWTRSGCKESGLIMPGSIPRALARKQNFIKIYIINPQNQYFVIYFLLFFSSYSPSEKMNEKQSIIFEWILKTVFILYRVFSFPKMKWRRRRRKKNVIDAS